jgi:hypothetical protein
MDAPESSAAVPRTYWLSHPRSSMFYCFIAALMFGDDWWRILSGARKPGLSDFLFPSIYLLFICVVAIVTRRTFVRLSEDSIECSTVRRRKVLPFDKIKGRRRYTEKADPYSTPAQHLVLEPNDDRSPRIDIKIKDNYRFDESFYRWFDSLPDLDKSDGLDALQSKYSNFSLV